MFYNKICDMSQSLWHFVTESGESGFSRWCPDHNRLMRCRSGWMINYRWHTDSETSTLWQPVSMIPADQALRCDCMAASWAFCQCHNIVIEIDVVPFITLLWDCCSLGGLSRSCSDVSWSRRTVPQCSDLIGYSIVFQNHKRSYSVKSTQYYPARTKQ